MDISPLIHKLEKNLINKINKSIKSPVKMVGLCCQSHCDNNTNIFINAIEKSFQRDGFKFNLIRSDSHSLFKMIDFYNNDNETDAILLLRPIKPRDLALELAERINTLKDVEGINDFGGNKPYLQPFTATAVVEILKWYFGDKPLGNIGKVVILNSSPIFGQPIYKILVGLGVSAKILDKTDNSLDIVSDFNKILCESDVILSAVSDPSFELPLNKLKMGALVVDVADFNVRYDEEVKKSGINVIKNVGPVTILMLKRNLVSLIAARE